MWIGVGTAGWLANISDARTLARPVGGHRIGVVGVSSGIALPAGMSGGVTGFNVMSILTAIIGSAALIAVLHTFRRA
jgi:uncharacterized membrane protein YeaQ/YmgE (transglycosylase-associated protein family)